MIYLDSSVALAHLLAEDRFPPEKLWRESLVSSRLLQFETWNRINALGLGASLGELVQEVIARLAIIEMTPQTLARALEPFPVPVRTLDTLHLASMHYLASLGQNVCLASYDQRLLEAAGHLGFEPYPL